MIVLKHLYKNANDINYRWLQISYISSNYIYTFIPIKNSSNIFNSDLIIFKTGTRHLVKIQRFFNWSNFIGKSSSTDYDQLFSPNYTKIHLITISNSLEFTEYDFTGSIENIDLMLYGFFINPIGDRSFYVSFLGSPSLNFDNITKELVIIKVDTDLTDEPWYKYSFNR